MFPTVTIIAPGLLGASLGQAITERGLAERVHIWARRPEARLACEEASWCAGAFPTTLEAVRDADLIVICTPVEFIPEMVKSFRSGLKAGSIVTDVGSTKSLVCRRSHASMPAQSTFIGSHPMAGSEKSGMEYAEAGLFEGRACFVTPLEETPEEHVLSICRFWRSLGMEIQTASPEKHDEIVAHISHLPHVLASALACQLAETPGWEAFAGQGLRDTTRIAEGHPGVWKSILEQNDAEILRAIRGFERSIQELRSAMENKEWHQVKHFLERGRQYRERLG